jgi:anti-anti-sigma regulatory factor
MATTAETLRIDSAGAAGLLQRASEQVKNGANEVIVEFGSVRRIDPRILLLLEQLAAEGAKRKVNISLRGVNIDVYKVIKLSHLAAHFAFQN